MQSMQQKKKKKKKKKKNAIKLHGCAGWSAPLLFAYSINRVSHDLAQIRSLKNSLLQVGSSKVVQMGEVWSQIQFDRSICKWILNSQEKKLLISYGPRQTNLVLIAYASSEGSGEPAHPRSLARTFAARSYKQWVKRNLQTESQIPGPSEWLGMRS